MKHFYARTDFSKEVNEIPDEFLNKVICGDSLEELKRMPDNCVDLIFTSPPYNFDMDYDEHADDQDWDAYFSQLYEILSECVRVLKWGGRLIVNIQPLFSDYVPTHHMISNHLTQNEGLIWRGEILWEKNHYNCHYTAWGSWKSPSSPYLKYTWEMVEVFCKGELKKDGLAENADIEGEDFKKWVYAKWSIAPERKMKEYGHPAMFPEELAKRCIQLFSFKGDSVLDPFAGVGTACVVSMDLERDYIGIDISEKYCDTARKRIAKLEKKRAQMGRLFAER